MSADRISLANRLRAARTHGGASPDANPTSSPSGDASSDPVVPMTTLLIRPTPVPRSLTSVEFHNYESVWDVYARPSFQTLGVHREARLRLRLRRGVGQASTVSWLQVQRGPLSGWA
ncbi:hypothetical protein CYMTET_34531 [Cymbomonas tetramitiformis]|uniref:Uncharacterized protein n=1 Tax=Cymbomonas tetramitiformis TaxID=36881 RepID=A0AAE0KQ35_9CHLO|nr:hypothetical protein CYMTET_34531 [Cymbomonas tetramitiformis]